MKNISESLRLLVDFSFDEFVTPRIIGIIYGLGWIYALVSVMLRISAAFAISEGRGLLVLFASPFLFAFNVLVIRVALEVVMAIFTACRKSRKIDTEA